jgi:phosphate transport system protein
LVSYRKLIKFGESSYVISLPIDWVKKNDLEKGSTIFVNESSSSELILSLDNSTKRKDYEIVIDLKNKDKHQVHREVTSAYVKGATTIIIKGSKLKSNFSVVKSLLHNLMGLEIMEQTSTKIVAKDILSVDTLSIDHLIRRITIITESMLEDSKKITTNFSNYRNLKSRDTEVNRLVFLVLRIIKMGFNSPALAKQIKMTNEDLFKNWNVVDFLEEIADEAKRISRIIPEIDSSKLEDTKFNEIYDEIRELYKSAKKAYYLKNQDLAFEVSSCKTSLVKKCDNLLEEHNTAQMARIVERMKAMIASIRNIARIVYQ